MFCVSEKNKHYEIRNPYTVMDPLGYHLGNHTSKGFNTYDAPYFYR